MVKYYIGEAVAQVVHTSVMAAVAMVELVEVVAVHATMFQALVQDKVTAEAAVKHSTKAAQHQTVTATHDLAATVVLILVAAEAMADHIMAPAGLESL
jgi:Ca2+/H+ antiporter